MRRLFTFKPLHGWRAFWGEVGIIVLGVLLALGAQQVVEDWQWKKDVAEFRAAVREEIEHNLWTYPYRSEQKDCIARRLDELQRWLDGWRAGRSAKLTGPIGMPMSLVIYTSAWDSRDAGTLSHMPRAEGLGYGDLYSEFANSEVHRLDERETWIELASFDGATLLTHEDQMKLQGLITRARLRDMRLNGNYERFAKRAAAIGLRPVAIPDTPLPSGELCRPILPPARAS